MPPPALLREYAVALMPVFAGLRLASIAKAPVPPAGMRRLLFPAALVTTRSALAVGLKSIVTRANPVPIVNVLVLMLTAAPLVGLIV